MRHNADKSISWLKDSSKLKIGLSSAFVYSLPNQNRNAAGDPGTATRSVSSDVNSEDGLGRLRECGCLLPLL